MLRRYHLFTVLFVWSGLFWVLTTCIQVFKLHRAMTENLFIDRLEHFYVVPSKLACHTFSNEISNIGAYPHTYTSYSNYDKTHLRNTTLTQSLIPKLPAGCAVKILEDWDFCVLGEGKGGGVNPNMSSL